LGLSVPALVFMVITMSAVMESSYGHWECVEWGEHEDWSHMDYCKAKFLMHTDYCQNPADIEVVCVKEVWAREKKAG